MPIHRSVRRNARQDNPDLQARVERLLRSAPPEEQHRSRVSYLWADAAIALCILWRRWCIPGLTACHCECEQSLVGMARNRLNEGSCLLNGEYAKTPAALRG
jgi:hypothetical protein